jgi:hypothetical protein
VAKLVNGDWRKNAKDHSNVKGEYSLRGFKGNCEIVVKAVGSTKTLKNQIGDRTALVNVVM